MKLLSICIPTFNRNIELSDLSQRFLVPALNMFSDDIEVVVCDNSDIEFADLNIKVLDPRVIYHHNEINLGFAGNFLRCTKEAASKFIWIISDDDIIVFNGFIELMASLKAMDDEGADCIMLPFQTIDLFGNVKISNRLIDWSLTKDIKVVDLLLSGNLPFILFSGAVIRNAPSRSETNASTYSKNDYVQVMIFLDMLKPDSMVHFLEKTVIDYQPEYDTRFSILSMERSMREVRFYVREKYGVSWNKKNDFRYWLVWFYNHCGGLYSIKNADLEKLHYIRGVFGNLCMKNIILCLVLLLPKSIIKVILMFHKCLTETRSKNGGICLFLLNIKRYREFVFRLNSQRVGLRSVV